MRSTRTAKFAALAASCLSFVAARPQPLQSPQRDKSSAVQFEAEVSRGQKFSRDISRGLTFRLTPVVSPASGSGWDIEIYPSADVDRPLAKDYVSIATPPYHFNTIYTLSTGYATKAQDAVRPYKRNFYFVLNAADYQAVGDEVNLLLYQNNATQDELRAANDKMHKVFIGVGTVEVLDSSVKPGTSDQDLGSIDWVKFRATFKFDSGKTMAEVLGLDEKRGGV